MAESIKNIIEKIITDFAKNKVFSNEQQLQFELAWALKDKLKDEYEVLLEVLSKEEYDDKKKYIDIVLKKESDKTFIPIELKYKTPNKNYTYYSQDGSIIGKTFNQGAADVGSYLFWKDVERVENLTNGETGKLVNYNDYKAETGIVIILTNYSRYWSIGRSKKSALYEDYFPYGGKTKPEQTYGDSYVIQGKIYVDKTTGERSRGNGNNDEPCEVLSWLEKHDNKDIEGAINDWKDANFNCSIIRPIYLNSQYECKWKDYSLSNCQYEDDNGKRLFLDDAPERPWFKYLILEIPAPPKTNNEV